jgi:hypothetical protein
VGSRATGPTGGAQLNDCRKARRCCGSHALHCCLPQRSLTRMSTAKPPLTPLASSQRGGMTFVRRRSAAKARSARGAGRPSWRGRPGTLRGVRRAAASAARPRHGAGKGAGDGPSANVGASRLSATNALPVGQACGGTFARRGGRWCHPQRMRRARGPRASLAWMQPGAPSGVRVRGLWRPRVTQSRQTARQRASRSRGAVDSVSHTFRPSTQRPQTHTMPVWLPPRQRGS